MAKNRDSSLKAIRDIIRAGINRAKDYEKQGQFDAALKECESHFDNSFELCESAPYYEDIISIILELHSAASDLYERQKQLIAAIKIYQALVNTYPNNWIAHVFLCKYYLLQGYFDEAVKEYLESMNAGRPFDEFHDIFKVFKKQLSITNMIRMCEALVKEDDNNLIAHLYLGQCYEDQGDPERAWNEYSSILKIDPNDILGNRYLWGIFEKYNNLEVAAALYNNLLNKDPNNVRARLHLGKCYEQQGFFDKAAKIYEVMFNFVPDDNKAYSALESVLNEQNVHDAIMICKLVLANYPDNKNALSHLAQLYKSEFVNESRKADILDGLICVLDDTYERAQLGAKRLAWRSIESPWSWSN